MNIKISNLNTIEYCDLDIDNITYLLSGLNEDDEGQISNGSGKTTFINAFCIAICDKSIDGSSIKSLIGSFGEEMIIKLEIDDLIIQRTYGTTGQQVVVRLNNKQIDVPTRSGGGLDIKAANQWILNYFNLSVEEILSFYILAPKYYNPFLSATDSKKISVLSKITSTKVTDESITEVKNLVSKKQKEKLKSEAELELLLSQKVNKDDLVQNKKALQKEKKNISEQIKRLDDQKVEISQESFDKLVEKRRKLDLNIKENFKQLHQSEFTVNSIEKELKEFFVTCPHCEHSFSKSGKDKSELQEMLEEAKNIRTQISSFIDNKNREKEEISRKINEIQKTKEEQWRINNSAIQLDKKLFEVKTKIVNINDRILAIKEKENQIEEKQSEITQIEGELINYSNQLASLKELRFSLSNRPVEIINNKINEFLSSMQSDMRVQIDGFKMLSSGEIKPSLATNVWRKGYKRDYHSFSQGEKARLNFACDIVIQEIISQIKNSSLSLYISDETFAGVDEKGIKGICSMGKYIQKPILLVTHSANQLLTRNNILAKKSNGTTTVEKRKEVTEQNGS